MTALIIIIAAAIGGVAWIAWEYTRLERIRRLAAKFNANHDLFIEAVRRGDLQAMREINARGEEIVSQARRI